MARRDPHEVGKAKRSHEERLRDLYLNLLERSLTGVLAAPVEISSDPRLVRRPWAIFGDQWPTYLLTMVGSKRLRHLRWCVETVVAERVRGDLIECGAWRGGASILMQAVLKAHQKGSKTVWVADSFEGLPPPDPKYPADEGADWHEREDLAVSLEEVKGNFERYGLLDDRVRFLKGFFRDTLPDAPVERLALVRLDGDMYESTIDGLTNLYPKLSVGGFLIVDDYGAVEACKEAVHDYRRENGITEPIERIDWTGAYWRRAQ